MRSGDIQNGNEENYTDELLFNSLDLFARLFKPLGSSTRMVAEIQRRSHRFIKDFKKKKSMVN